MDNKNSLKKKIHDTLRIQLDKKIKLVNKNMLQVQEGLTSESKSSAGDKHETGRAMLHLTQEKNYQQLQILLNQKKVLHQIQFLITSDKISLGSLVTTSDMVYFIAIGIGKISIEEKNIYVISPLSPIGKLLLNKTLKDFPLETPFGLFLTFS